MSDVATTPETDRERHRASLLAVLRRRQPRPARRGLHFADGAQPTVRRRMAELENGSWATSAFHAPRRRGFEPTALGPRAGATPAQASGAWPPTPSCRAAFGRVRLDAALGVVRITASDGDRRRGAAPGPRRASGGHIQASPSHSVHSNRNEVDLLRREADLAIRMVRPTQGGPGRTARIGDVRLGLLRPSLRHRTVQDVLDGRGRPRAPCR